MTCSSSKLSVRLTAHTLHPGPWTSPKEELRNQREGRQHRRLKQTAAFRTKGQLSDSFFFSPPPFNFPDGRMHVADEERLRVDADYSRLRGKSECVSELNRLVTFETNVCFITAMVPASPIRASFSSTRRRRRTGLSVAR